jgi:hypothetical protein
MDNEFLNGYSKLVGPYGTLVYMALCRHAANETQECFPSIQTICEETGIKSRTTVIKGLTALRELSIISIRGQFEEGTGRRKNNTYTLLSRSFWKKIPQINTPHVKEEKAKEPEIELPEWIKRDVWNQWVQFRKEKRQSLKPSTIRLQISFLEKHKTDYEEIIMTSIRQGWTGLFPLKKTAMRTPANAFPATPGKYAKYGTK